MFRVWRRWCKVRAGSLRASAERRGPITRGWNSVRLEHVACDCAFFILIFYLWSVSGFLFTIQVCNFFPYNIFYLENMCLLLTAEQKAARCSCYWISKLIPNCYIFLFNKLFKWHWKQILRGHKYYWFVFECNITFSKY